MKKFPRTLTYENCSYADMKLMKPLSKEKLDDLKQMYTSYLQHDEQALNFYKLLVEENVHYGPIETTINDSQPKRKRKRPTVTSESQKRQKTLHECI